MQFRFHSYKEKGAMISVQEQPNDEDRMQYHVCNPESINRYTFNKKTNKKEGLQRKDDTSDRPMIRNYRWVAQNRKKCSWIRLFLLD
jgi:hypothetical protein